MNMFLSLLFGNLVVLISWLTPMFGAATTVIQDFFAMLGDGVTGIFELINSLITGAISIFYVASVGEIEGYFTFPGVLLLVGIVYSIARKFISWIQGFVRMKG